MPKQSKRKSQPVSSSNPFPYHKSKLRIPREITSAASLWLDFFQQAIDLTVSESPGVSGDRLAVGRARMIADCALTAFQERFPGVHP